MGAKASKAKRPLLKPRRLSSQESHKILPSAQPHEIPSQCPHKIPSPQQDTVPIPLQDTVHETPQDAIPIIPLDIINEILDHLVRRSDFRSCALVSRPWVQPCQRRIFHKVRFSPARAHKWLKTFPVQEDSPAHYVRVLCLVIGRQGARIPEKFFECIPWFTDVDSVSFLGHGGAPLTSEGVSSSSEPSLWKLPRSVTSLTIYTDMISLVQVRDTMAQLPNLNDLELLRFTEADGRKLSGIGTVLEGRFGGRLILKGKCIGEGVINMLLEIPSGLHFAELDIYCTKHPLPSSAIRLAEACRKTLVKLSHRVGYKYTRRHDSIERSFDFSTFPNIQEVTFGFWDDLRVGGLPWIPMALSTLKPATSPRLSIVKFEFTSSIGVHIETMITDMGNDLRRIANEVARIECEFEGAVNFTVVRDSEFRAVLNSLNVLQKYAR